MRLQPNVVIVSGGARGIGAAEARALVKHGARVVIGDLLDGLGGALATELNAGKPERCAQYLHLDATRMEDWEGAVKLTEESFGRLTTLVNNAGVHGRLGLEDTSEDEWHRVLDADLKSAWLGMKACIPAMRRAGGGSIVNTSSVYGLVASGAATAYHSAKGGVLMLSKAAAVQYAPENIRVNCVHPGLIDTPMTATLPPAWKQSLLTSTPFKRFGRPEEVAAAVVFLVSEESSFITGASIVIDGGLTAT
jgi:NAD(P)-dependent dehydrogenase (short-subunit alcohol dehydrogenase family)